MSEIEDEAREEEAKPLPDIKVPTREWSVAAVSRDAMGLLTEHGFPQMARPEGYGQSYQFPTNVDILSDRDLGSLQLRLAGWLTYLLQVLAREDIELGAFETVYDIKLGAAMQVASVRSDKRVVKDVLRAVTITDSADLTMLTQALITRRAKVKALQAQETIYREQLTRLSREQSRRESLARSGF